MPHIHAMITKRRNSAALAARDATRNGDDSHSLGTGARRPVQVALKCTYPNFLKCQTLNFKGTEGVVGLTQWFEKMESVYSISNCTVTCQRTLKKMMIEKYCPRGEIKKLEIEMWNLKKKYTKLRNMSVACPRHDPMQCDGNKAKICRMPLSSPLNSWTRKSTLGLNVRLTTKESLMTPPGTTRINNQTRDKTLEELMPQEMVTGDHTKGLDLCSKCNYHMMVLGHFKRNAKIEEQQQPGLIGFRKCARFHAKLYARGQYRSFGDKQEAAFQLLKQKLCSAPILALPEGSEDFIAYCDASNKGLGAVLMQRENVISYASCQFRQVQLTGPRISARNQRRDHQNKQKIQTAQRSTKSYDKQSLNPIKVFQFGDKVMHKVGAVAYKLELPQELSRVHNTFHVSNLKKCYSDDPLDIPLEGLQVDDKLHFVEEPVEIMDREVKQLRGSRVPIVKVQWNSRRGPEFTWEREDQFRKKYPHLFTKTAPSSRLGYNDVPPPYTRNFMPPKSDLVYLSLDDFVDMNESVSEFIVEKPTVEINELETSRKENGAPIIED
ncbi:putative reverse transcriptase domain-containing protein [Tanacetum coccineum]|uniref:Reverse transcriptase domain-containing protein n=1 Tax=Tanacetum coccineum TaxID=301880 RepID=A0ABQ4ZF26_9ASTR